MRKWRVLPFLVVLVLLLLPLSGNLLVAQEDELSTGMAMVVVSSRVYEETSTSSERLAALEIGNLVDILEINEQWARIIFEDIEGWMRTQSILTGGSTLVNVSGPAPGPRAYHALAYDVESDRVILYGGSYGTDVIYDDTWAYDVSMNSWTEMTPVDPPIQARGPMAYDAESDRMILFAESFTYGFEALPTQTWAYDFNTDSWTNMEPAVAPPPSFDCRMAYDSESDRIILFGGIDTSVSQQLGARRGLVFYDHTWAYDFNNNMWAQMTPAVSPPSASSFALTYDAGIDRIIVSGLSGSEHYPENWHYDYNTDTWEKLETAEHPGDRVGSAMVYAGGPEQSILFGGGSQHGHSPVDLQVDTWAYNAGNNAWADIIPEASPGERSWHAMTYSPAANRVVLFGGFIPRGRDRDQQDGFFDTWLYDPVANSWTQVGP